MTAPSRWCCPGAALPPSAWSGLDELRARRRLVRRPWRLQHARDVASGYLDGMGLPLLTGGAWRCTRRSPVPDRCPRPPSCSRRTRRARAATARVVRRRSRRFRRPALRGAFLQAVAALARPERLYVHVDLDVLDADEARVNAYSARGGVSAAQLERSSVLAHCPVRAIALTAYDSSAEDRVPPIARAARVGRGIRGVATGCRFDQTPRPVSVLPTASRRAHWGRRVATRAASPT